MDNEIPLIDKTFSFETAVEEACRAISVADIEANLYEPGIVSGKLIGRHSGFIALHA